MVRLGKYLESLVVLRQCLLVVEDDLESKPTLLGARGSLILIQKGRISYSLKIANSIVIKSSASSIGIPIMSESFVDVGFSLRIHFFPSTVPEDWGS